MQRRLTTLFSLAIGAAILVAPSLTNFGSDRVYDSALAAKGGNGNGNGGGKANGNGGGNSNATAGSKSNAGSKSASTGAKGLGKNKFDKALNSQMGALHSAGASASAFAHASANSRVGRIKEAVIASAAATAAKTAYEAAVQAAIAANVDVIAAQSAVDALKTTIADPMTDSAIVADLETQLAAAEKALADAKLVAAATVSTDLAVVEAQTALDAANLAADSAWDDAANKKPVSEAVKNATIQLVGDKVDTTIEPTTPTTP